MSLTRLAIEKKRITAVAVIALLLAGVAAFSSLPRSEDPGFTFRVASVITHYPGASPRRVEKLVTDRIEKAIQELPELDFVSSESKTGVSIILVKLKDRYTDLQPVWDRLRRKIERIRHLLPDGAMPPIVDDEFGDVFGIILALTGDGFSYRELKDVADEVRDDLLLVEDVAKVEIYGAQPERIFVEYSNARLAELGLSPMVLRQTLEAQNIVLSGGDISTGQERIVLEPSGNFESLEDLGRAILQLPGRPELVYLEDVATIRRAYIDPPQTMLRASGSPALGLAISMREGGDIIRLGREVRGKVELLRDRHPLGLDFDFVQFQPGQVQRKIDEFMASVGQAVAIVALSMLLTLGLRTGLVVASLIPSAMLMSLAGMQVFGVGLDQMSLASLIIALGMLVDNAIVMSESIMVQMREGKAAVDAAVDSASELQIPLLTSSLTTAAAFLPIVMAESSAGEYTAPLFKVVTITLLSSWLLSITMVPLLCVRFLRIEAVAGEDGFDSRFYRTYRGVLTAILRHRGAAMGVVAATFVVAMWSFLFIPVLFFPPNDRAMFMVDLDLPVGTPIEQTGEVVEQVERFLADELAVGPERDAGVTNWATFVGRGGPRFFLSYNPKMGAPEYAFLLVNTTSREMVDELMPRLGAFFQDRFPDLQASVRPLESGPPTWPPIRVRISGSDEDRIFEIVDRVKDRLASIPGTRLITDDWGARSKKIVVDVDQDRARRAGVTSQDVAISLQTFLSGFDTTEYREGDNVIPVTLRSTESERKDMDKLETLAVYSAVASTAIPLKQVADVRVEWQPARVRHYNRRTTVTVEAGLDPGFTATGVNAALAPWLEEVQPSWPTGHTWTLGGEAEESGKANKAIADKLPIAGLLIVFLLVAQFDSIRRTVIVLSTVPLALIGVASGLLLARSYFGFMTLLGVISLAGIVINNAIVLLDRIRIEIEENGLDPARAVLESAQRRLRPILLTTGTTVGGLLPLWFSGGPMWEPMAVTVIFGLLFATVLTLAVVPVLYSLLFGVDFRDLPSE
ncbi:MAG: efflux RND transporter permease subunit [Candidatus Binatia bacterium]